MFNLAVILRQSAMTSPGKAAIRHNGGFVAYAELDALSDSFAEGLAGLGVKPATRSACNCRTSPRTSWPTSASSRPVPSSSR